MAGIRLINRNDIETWAQTFGSKGDLPVLISRLVRAISPLSTQTEFPSGSSAFVGGWDGTVKCAEDRGYVPMGTSLWEFGTEDNAKGKADDDYKKRTKDPQGYDTKTSTFIFLTPKFWKFKEKWRLAKVKEGVWKDVKAYDSRDIEEWLDLAPAVAMWFSTHTRTYPPNGILTVERFWKEWAFGPHGELPPTIVTAGREHQIKQLQDFLSGSPGIKPFRASSKDEAIAFIVAAAKQLDLSASEIFFSRSLIIDTSANFRSISINRHPLYLISRVEETGILYAGVGDGHHVLVPLGADDMFNQDIIDLPSIDREGLIKALVLMGLSEEDARNYSKESGRNITILKRLLKFPQNNLDWIKLENVREIIPAMLLGRWDESKIGDKEILESLSGEKYEDYIIKVAKWRDYEVAPFMQIGNTWRLTSPMDAWSNLSPFLLKGDLEMLRECFNKAFGNGNPIIPPKPESLAISAFLNKETTFSNWAREGLVQSLILIGFYGENLKILNMPSPQIWVDNIIRSLILNADGNLWVSLDHEMPLIAEASPISFLEAVSASLLREDKPIMAMFIEEEAMLSRVSHHTGLLWALEGLCWLPDHLLNASLVLTKLAALDPGGQLANRPLNSLMEIFKPWHYQTFATLEERMQVLDQIAKGEKPIAWILFMRMLPNNPGGVAFFTHKMRWRMFGVNFTNKYIYKEIWDTHSHIIQLLLLIFDFSEEQFSQLLDISVHLRPADRNTVLEFAELEYAKVKQINFTAWHKLRKILSHHRSHPKTEWALPKNELARYEKLFNLLEPSDEIQKYKWLFDDHWPEFVEGSVYDGNNFSEREQEQQKKIDVTRVEGLKKILSKYGIEKIKDLGDTVKEPWFLGDILAKILDDESDILSIVELLKKENVNLHFVHGFLVSKVILNGIDWIFSLFNKLKSIEEFSNNALAQLLIPLNPSKVLWDFVDSTNKEIKEKYWLAMSPFFYNLSVDEKILGFNYLLLYRRFISAIHIGSHFVKDIPTELIVTILERTATEETSEKGQLHGYEVGMLFEALDKRDDIERKILIRLEWHFLQVLASYGNSRKPILLHEELATNPEFFIEVLKLVYKPKTKELVEEERKGLSEEIIRNRALQAYQLLNTWKKIPGVRDNLSIDNDFLVNWVSTVRDLAREADRLEVADIHIGQILAQFPEKEPNWPPDEICAIIESVNSDSIKRNFSAAVFNKRGSSVRGPFDGGEIERNHAAYFERLAALHKNKYPNLALILSRLAKGYIEDAKRMDQEAERDKLEY